MISSCWRCFRFVVFIIVKRQNIKCIVLVQVNFVFVFVFVSCMSLFIACHTLAMRLLPLRWSVLLAQECMSRPVRLRLLRQWDDGLRGRSVRRRRPRLLRVAAWVVQRRLWAVFADGVRAGLVSRRARRESARTPTGPAARRYSVGYGNVGCQSCAPGSYTYWDG